MAAAIDLYSSSSNSVFSDPFREELMKALEPFMKTASSTSPSSPSSSLSFSYSQLLSPSQPNMDLGFSNHYDPMGFELTGSIGLSQLNPSQIFQIQAQIYQQQQLDSMVPKTCLGNQRQRLNFLSPKAVPMKRVFSTQLHYLSFLFRVSIRTYNSVRLFVLLQLFGIPFLQYMI
ncbi:hypothetical protein like AT4G39780 [Hibiscus trionum]|uniref:Uncharacterized protein n=1 Tax=Hibiscus trionum TaxID=183268 RepID=A0A9W7IDU2_HIBTR|nr:hypothetical protein like AT4G39780 [Hibiscus trionum]